MTTLSREVVYRGRVFNVDRTSVKLPSGRRTQLDVIAHPGAAAMVPVTADGTILLVRQYRHATGDWLLEIPAGTRDGNEAPESCAQRELAEEVGHRAGEFVSLGAIWTTPGFTDERIWLYLARDLTAVGQNLDEDEELHVEEHPIGQVLDWANDGTISDAKTLCALYRAYPHLQRSL